MYASTTKHKILRMLNTVMSEMGGLPKFGFAVSHVGQWVSCKLHLKDACVNEQAVALKKLNCKRAEQLTS